MHHFLVLVLSRERFTYNNEPSRTHSFDTGAACENFALQGHINGLVVHAIGGFDHDKAKKEYRIPDDYTVELILAVGKLGNIHDLLPRIQEREKAYSDRKPIKEFVFEGIFKGS